MKQLIEKFFAGETSNEEERRLFEAFAPGRKVDPELEPYREMFAWYDSLSADRDAVVDAEADETPVMLPAPGRWRRRMAWISSAAAVAMIATVAVTYISRRQADIDRAMAQYAGSYVIENGVKNTDIAQILPRLEDAEALVDAQQREVERRLNSRLSRVSDDNVVDRVTSGSDERVRRHLESLLSD